MILGLRIFFFRKIDDTTMKEFTILFTENVLKQLPQKILDKKRNSS